MKKVIIILLSLTVLFACNSKNKDKQIVNDSTEFVDTSYIENTGHKDFLKTYPFSDCNKIEVISYHVRHYWDSTSVNGKARLNKVSIQNGKIDLDETQFIDRVVLTKEQQKELFNILYNSTCKEAHPAACFDPRHLIAFYNKDNRAYAFIEICFHCATTRNSENVILEDLCWGRLDKLRILFEKAGIKYFGDNEAY